MASTLEKTFAKQLVENQLPDPKREYNFASDRKWAFDFCWPEKMLAVEIEGGTWSRGRHTRAIGFANDCEKYNHAALAGWRVLRFTGDMVRDEKAIDQVRIALLGNLKQLEAA